MKISPFNHNELKRSTITTPHELHPKQQEINKSLDCNQNFSGQLSKKEQEDSNFLEQQLVQIPQINQITQDSNNSLVQQTPLAQPIKQKVANSQRPSYSNEYYQLQNPLKQYSEQFHQQLSSKNTQQQLVITANLIKDKIEEEQPSPMIQTKQHSLNPSHYIKQNTLSRLLTSNTPTAGSLVFNSETASHLLQLTTQKLSQDIDMKSEQGGENEENPLESGDQIHLEDDSIAENLSESDESFWEYHSSEEWQNIVPFSPLQKNTKQKGSANSGQSKQKKMGTGGPSQKDQYFGIDPLKLVVKEFPQGEDEEAVFHWWDQIDDVYFPAKIKEGFLDQLEWKNPRDFNEVIQNLRRFEVDESHVIRAPCHTSSSSTYYSMMKDVYCDESIPFKMHSYLSILFCDSFSNPQIDSEDIPLIRPSNGNTSWGYLAVYKLKNYEKRNKLTLDKKNVFDEFCQQLDITTSMDQKKIEEWSMKAEKSIEFDQQQLARRKKQQQIRREKPQLKEYEPDISKRFIGNDQIVPVLNESPPDGLNYDKNKVTLKLKKIIALEKNGFVNALQQTRFLNAFLSSRKKTTYEQDEEGLAEEHPQLSNLEKTQIENNIFSMEYLVFKLGIGQQLSQLKNKVLEHIKKEGDYLELRKLSIQINDNMKWLTIRKNIMMGFSDRIPFNSKNYFNQESEEKTGINLSHSDIVKQKLQFSQDSIQQVKEGFPLKLLSEGNYSQKYSSQKIKVEEKIEEVEEEKEDKRECPQHQQTGKKGEESQQVEKDAKLKKQINKKKKNKSKLLETDCSVCFHYVNNENNTVVYCSQCNSSFHKHCYGIDFIPEERFLCKKCESKNFIQLQQKKRTFSNSTNKPLKEDIISRQYACKLCTETQLPVISLDFEIPSQQPQHFYHPTCLFIFNYCVYKDSCLQFRANVTHRSIAKDIQKQLDITCEHCLSKKGLKVKCCGGNSHINETTNKMEDSIKVEDQTHEMGCNYYVHPLCAFLNGMEIWLEEGKDDDKLEKIMVDSNFQRLCHLGLNVRFKCIKHADKINRNCDEQTYYRRFQINYKNICQFETLAEYLESVTKQRSSEEESWNDIIQKENEYKEQYAYLTQIKINTKEIEASTQEEELFYKQNPQMKVLFHELEVEEEQQQEDTSEQNNPPNQIGGTSGDEDGQQGNSLRAIKEGDVSKEIEMEDEEIEEREEKTHENRRTSSEKSKERQKNSKNRNSYHKKMLVNSDDEDEVEFRGLQKNSSSRGTTQKDESDKDDFAEEESSREDKDDEYKDVEQVRKFRRGISGRSQKALTRLTASRGVQGGIKKRGQQLTASEIVKKKVLSNSRSIAQNGKIGKGTSIFAFHPKKDTLHESSELFQEEDNTEDQQDEDFVKNKKSRQTASDLQANSTKYNLRKQQSKNYKSSFPREEGEFLNAVTDLQLIQSQRNIMRQLNINEEQTGNEEEFADKITINNHQNLKKTSTLTKKNKNEPEIHEQKRNSKKMFDYIDNKSEEESSFHPNLQNMSEGGAGGGQKRKKENAKHNLNPQSQPINTQHVEKYPLQEKAEDEDENVFQFKNQINILEQEDYVPQVSSFSIQQSSQDKISRGSHELLDFDKYAQQEKVFNQINIKNM